MAELGPIATRILYEDDDVRIWDQRLAPGESTAAHHHENDYALVDVEGDRVDVFPASAEHAHLPRTAAPPPRPPRFVLDVHLRRLAVYLRLLGFDAVWWEDAADPDSVPGPGHDLLRGRDLRAPGARVLSGAALGHADAVVGARSARRHIPSKPAGRRKRP